MTTHAPFTELSLNDDTSVVLAVVWLVTLEPDMARMADRWLTKRFGHRRMYAASKFAERIKQTIIESEG